MFTQLFYVRAARVRSLMGVAALCLLTAACAAAPERLIVGADPSDPAAGVPAASYRLVLRGYVSQRPVEPVSWREQNERVAPARKQ